MNWSRLELPDVLLIEPRVMRDERGAFFEGWNRDLVAALGIDGEFVQDNISLSERDVVRGLHLQHPFGQGKLVTALHGEIFDVAVDVRRDSATFGRWCGVTLSADAPRQLYIPPGFAHGFVVLSASATVGYKVTERYHPETELTIAWNDPAIGVEWPLRGAPRLSPRDAAAPLLADIAPEALPTITMSAATSAATPSAVAAELGA